RKVDDRHDNRADPHDPLQQGHSTSCRVAETNVRLGWRQRGKSRRIRGLSSFRSRYPRSVIVQPRANNSPMPMTRRSFVAAVSGSLTMFSRSLRAQERDVEFAFRQYHNQTTASSLHMRLVQMWDAVYKESGGRLVCRVFPQNNNIQGSDP